MIAGGVDKVVRAVLAGGGVVVGPDAIEQLVEAGAAVAVEAFRALEKEVLEEMGLDGTLSEGIRERSREVRLRYPSPQVLLAHILSDAPQPGLPLEWTQAFRDALALFRKVHYGGLGSKETRHAVLYTLRHFPERGTIDILESKDGLWPWLEPEDR